jgi:hypothetical protein
MKEYISVSEQGTMAADKPREKARTVISWGLGATSFIWIETFQSIDFPKRPKAHKKRRWRFPFERLSAGQVNEMTWSQEAFERRLTSQATNEEREDEAQALFCAGRMFACAADYA